MRTKQLASLISIEISKVSFSKPILSVMGSIPVKTRSTSTTRRCSPNQSQVRATTGPEKEGTWYDSTMSFIEIFSERTVQNMYSAWFGDPNHINTTRNYRISNFPINVIINILHIFYLNFLTLWWVYKVPSCCSKRGLTRTPRFACTLYRHLY